MSSSNSASAYSENETNNSSAKFRQRGNAEVQFKGREKGRREGGRGREGRGGESRRLSQSQREICLGSKITIDEREREDGYEFATFSQTSRIAIAKKEEEKPLFDIDPCPQPGADSLVQDGGCEHCKQDLSLHAERNGSSKRELFL